MDHINKWLDKEVSCNCCISCFHIFCKIFCPCFVNDFITPIDSVPKQQYMSI